MSHNQRKKPAGRSRRHQPEEAEQLIIERAIQFLWERPFRDLNVAKLMAGMALSRPAFYQYFDDVHDLIESLLRDIESAMHQRANPWIRGEGEPIAGLRVALAGIIQTCVERGPVLRAVTEAAPLDERLERAWSNFMQRWHNAVEARIKAQQAEGLISESLHARRTAKALNALDAAVLISEFGHRPQGDPEAVLETLHSIWVATLYGRSPRQLRKPKPSKPTPINKKRNHRNRS